MACQHPYYDGPERRALCVRCEHFVRWHTEGGCMMPSCPCRLSQNWMGDRVNYAPR